MSDPHDRPDYVKCVLLGTFDGDATKPVQQTWCGRRPYAFEFTFVDPSHALLNARRHDRLLVCPECSDALARTLAEGTAPRSLCSDVRAMLSLRDGSGRGEYRGWTVSPDDDGFRAQRRPDEWLTASEIEDLCGMIDDVENGEAP